MSKLKVLYSLLVIALCLVSEHSFAQKNNHIVLNDTIYSEGFIEQDEENISRSVFFKRRRKDPWVKFSVEEVNEYYQSNTKYLSKNLTEKEGNELVFLELIPIRFEGYQVLASLESKEDIYLESPDGFQKLGGDFKEVLRGIADNPELDPLLAITKFKPFNIAYYLSEAGTFRKTRTYAPVTSVSFFAGTGSGANQIPIPFTNEVSTVNGTTNQVGFLFEMALNQKRNIALSSGLTLYKVTSQEFLQFEDSNTSYEIDVYLDYEVVQVPFQVRYYAEIIPNSWRGYIELGYGFSFLGKSPFKLKVAEIEGSDVLTYQSEYEFSGTFNGINGSLGIEKLLPKSKAIVLGLKIFNHNSEKEEKFSAATGFIGFKF